MAINFEAANMAGYNNPKIEVFKVTLDSNDKITGAPPQTVIANCINRGSIPFILLDYDGGSTYLLSLYNAVSSGSLTFIATSKSFPELIISYSEEPNEPPVFQAKP